MRKQAPRQGDRRKLSRRLAANQAARVSESSSDCEHDGFVEIDHARLSQSVIYAADTPSTVHSRRTDQTSLVRPLVIEAADHRGKQTINITVGPMPRRAFLKLVGLGVV